MTPRFSIRTAALLAAGVLAVAAAPADAQKALGGGFHAGGGLAAGGGVHAGGGLGGFHPGGGLRAGGGLHAGAAGGAVGAGRFNAGRPGGLGAFHSPGAAAGQRLGGFHHGHVGTPGFGRQNRAFGGQQVFRGGRGAVAGLGPGHHGHHGHHGRRGHHGRHWRGGHGWGGYGWGGYYPWYGVAPYPYAYDDGYVCVRRKRWVRIHHRLRKVWRRVCYYD